MEIRFRCCFIDKQSRYFGIDREVNLKIFCTRKNKEQFDIALKHYIQYLSCEAEYTPENIALIVPLVKLINKAGAMCETILYARHPIESVEHIFLLGIDVVDPHLKSMLKHIPLRARRENVNIYGLFPIKQDAQSYIRKLCKLSNKYNGIYPVYVYRIIGQGAEKCPDYVPEDGIVCSSHQLSTSPFNQ